MRVADAGRSPHFEAQVRGERGSPFSARASPGSRQRSCCGCSTRPRRSNARFRARAVHLPPGHDHSPSAPIPMTWWSTWRSRLLELRAHSSSRDVLGQAHLRFQKHRKSFLTGKSPASPGASMSGCPATCDLVGFGLDASPGHRSPRRRRRLQGRHRCDLASREEMLGATVPMRFHAGEPFHAGLAWQMMEVGLKGMSAVLSE